ncbi:hypothetical protein DL93DRAFT_1353203 [Clavulina sp. PMI_390]|nr:hypothetical protein DL93DRAFT_1353203 [Clavulina sp. PMI_390]
MSSPPSSPGGAQSSSHVSYSAMASSNQQKQIDRQQATIDRLALQLKQVEAECLKQKLENQDYHAIVRRLRKENTSLTASASDADKRLKDQQNWAKQIEATNQDLTRRSIRDEVRLRDMESELGELQRREEEYKALLEKVR